jgi:hypothetical protein
MNMSAVQRWVLAASGGTLLALGIILVLWLGRCAPTPGPKIDARTQALLDSLKATNAQYAARKDSIITLVRVDTVRAGAQDAAAERSRADAAAAGRVADSLAVAARTAATAQDSATRWRAAYDARTRERDTLLVTVVRKDSAYRSERDAVTRLLTVHLDDSTRLAGTERVNAGLVKDIARLQQPCKLLGPIPCPNRTVTGLVSAGLGYLAGRKAP